MSYTMHEWQAREGTGLSKFTDTISGQVFNFESTPDSISVEGTPVSPPWLNEMEQGIYDGNTLILTENPTASTVGSVGQFALNTVNNEVYVCISASGNTYTWSLYGAFVVGDTLTTVRTNLDDSWLLCNGATVQSADYPILSALMPGLQNGIYSSLQLDFSSTGADTGPDVLVTNGDNVFVGSLDNGRMIYTNDINANPPVWGTSANSVGSYSTDMICYGDGCWAAAFNLSAFYTNIYTATDPSGSWSSTQIHLQYDRNIVYITFGDGYFVALGNGSICYTQTPDVRESWEQSEISGGICYMIAYGNGYWVVSQEYGYIAYSNSLSGSFTRKQISSGRMEGIYFLNGIWLAINSQGLLYTATDPTGEWVQNTSAPEMYTSTTNKQTMLYDNGLYIAIAVINSANQLVFATDPTGEWTPIPTAWNPSSITGANGTYVAGGYRITDDLIGLPQISLDKTYTYIKAK